MSDLGTMNPTQRDEGASERSDGRRRIRPSRGLPGSRAVVGALLVTAAAVGVFAAYLDATAAPDQSYVVARGDVEIGTPLLELTEAFEVVPMDLPPEMAGAAVEPADLSSDEALAGRIMLAPLRDGDLLLETHVGDGSSDDGSQISFAVPNSRAVGGTISPGDRIDVLVTYGTGGESSTRFAVRDARVDRTAGSEAGLGEEETAITVTLEEPEQLQALAHAVNNGEIFVVRTTGDPDEASDAEVPGYVPPGIDEAPEDPAQEPANDDADADADEGDGSGDGDGDGGGDEGGGDGGGS